MSLRRTIEHTVWARRGVAGRAGAALLRPLSLAFGAGVALRNRAYDIGLRRAHTASVPVVSVGNLAVGGTGKTPVTLWLARELRARGMRAGIVLRGYGGQGAAVTVVSRGSGPEVTPAVAGDEAVMLAKCFNGPVVTAARRRAGAAAAAELGCNVIVLDDGFQHRALARQFDVVLVDGRAGPLLPAGPFREGPAALRRADAIVRFDDDGAAALPRDAPAVYAARIEPIALVESVEGRWVEHPLAGLAGRHVVVVCAIAQPERFYALLRRWEVVIDDVYEFADHHRYAVEDWHAIARRGLEAGLIVTTEKDLVKLEAFPFAAGTLMAVRVAPVVERGEELLASCLSRMAGLYKADARRGMP
jgi:tetraacyldisaccharide 4'-kinase